MPQSNVIFAFLFAAFLIFITSRGELPSYGRVFFGSSGSGGAVSNAPGQGGGGSSSGPLGAVTEATSTITSTLSSVNKIGAFLGSLF